MSSFPVSDSSLADASTITSTQKTGDRLRGPNNRQLGSPIHSLALHSDAIWGLVGQKNGAIRLVSLRLDEGTVVHTFRQHVNAVSAIAITADETSFISGSWDNTVAVRQEIYIFRFIEPVIVEIF